MRRFTINGKEYIARGFDFNTVCDLEDLGVSLDGMDEKPMSMVRAYFQLCAGVSKKDAGNILQAHLISGGSMDELTKAMSLEMEESDFFQALSKKAKADAAEMQGEAKQEETTEHSVND